MKGRFCQIFLAPSILLLFFVLLSGCSKPAAKTDAAADVDYYTCTMHPSVHSKDPGKCPICSMDLVPVKLKTAQNNGVNGGTQSGMEPKEEMKTGSVSQLPAQSTEFTVPVERQQQIGVTYATVTKRPIQLSIRSVGMLESDSSKIFDYVARIDGYVQELKVSSPGQQVSQGQPLITIYSPDLHSTEQELVNILNDRDRGGIGRSSNDQLIDASKRRLKLWNVSDQEIAELEKTRKPSDQLILRSPFDGVVNEVISRPGMNVKTGDKLVSILDLSTLWVWAEFYENEVGLLKQGQAIAVTLPAFPNQTFQGRIAAISPTIDAAKRTIRVRIDIPNPKDQLHPGMYANVEVKIDDGEGLTIPVQAALPTGERMLVFVDRGEGKLLPRYVQVSGSFTIFDGEAPESYYRIVKGLKEGERIVASANFLIDAESQVQGALKDWQEEQIATPLELTAMPPNSSANSDFDAALKLVLESYKKLHGFLAENKFEQVSGGYDALKKRVEALSDVKPRSNEGRYTELLHKLHDSIDRLDPEDIDQARIEFGQLSTDLIVFVKDFMSDPGDPLYVIQCPMWKKSAAVWLQDSPNIENPFLGPAMPNCGVVGETLQVKR